MKSLHISGSMICASQKKYVEKVFQRFNMNICKVASTPLASHFKLSSCHSPSSEKDKKKTLGKVLYALAMGRLIYVTVCTRLDIANAVRVVSQFLSDFGKEE